MIKSELEIAKSLIDAKNWHKANYLHQFNECYRRELKEIFRDLPEQTLQVKQKKARKAHCINCNDVFTSFDVKEDLGLCFSCNFSENKRIKKKQENFWKNANGTTGRIIFVPKHLGSETISKICKFFVHNYFELDKYKNKKEAYEDIKQNFKVPLSHREFESITNLTFLEDHGFNFSKTLNK